MASNREHKEEALGSVSNQIGPYLVGAPVSLIAARWLCGDALFCGLGATPMLARILSHASVSRLKLHGCFAGTTW